MEIYVLTALLNITELWICNEVNSIYYKKLKVNVKWSFHAQGRFDHAMAFNCCVIFFNET